MAGAAQRIACIRARIDAEIVVLDKIVAALLKRRSKREPPREFTAGELVDLRGLEDDGWTNHEHYEQRMEDRRQTFARVQRYLRAAVERGELTKSVRHTSGWMRAYYGAPRNAT